jgi:antitoxin CcdA
MNAIAHRTSTSRSTKQVRAQPAPATRAPAARARAPREPTQRVPARRARKAPTNLSLRIDLVQQAKALDLNLSEVVERALEKAIVEAEQARWLAENKEAIDQYNAFVEEHGYFGEEFGEL